MEFVTRVQQEMFIREFHLAAVALNRKKMRYSKLVGIPKRETINTRRIFSRPITVLKMSFSSVVSLKRLNIYLIKDLIVNCI